MRNKDTNPSKLKKSQAKKMATTLGVHVKDIVAVVNDLQEMELLRYIGNDEWELYTGTSWLIIELKE